MSTRLDRLILLLDTGSTTTVRSSAAKQLGAIQKQHPEELYHLLSRILPFLKSKTWETRSAAAQAIDAIASNVQPWDPVPIPGAKESKDISTDPLISALFRFDTFSIEDVIEKGTTLLGSSGQEYDVNMEGMDSKEKIALFKKQLKQKLGFAGFQDDDFFDEADVSGSAKSKRSSSPVVKSEPLPDQYASLSARERNRLKRKAKKGQLDESIKSSDLASSKRRKVDDSSKSGGTAEKVVVSHKKVDGLSELSSLDEWPFEGVCEILCRDLFSPVWEFRHGAAIAMRAILKNHIHGCGRIAGATRDENEERHIRWLEDVSIKLLCILCLDRFADYVGDHVVVPVRESCAQTLAVIMQNSPVDLCKRVVDKGFLPMIYGRHAKSIQDRTSQSWTIRHSALIGLKYWMAVRKDLVGIIFTDDSGNHLPAFSAILAALNDSDDDVKSIAASALIPISSDLLQVFNPNIVFDTLIKSLWSCLQDLDDLTAATSFVMDLMADLITKPEVSDVIKNQPDDFLLNLVPQLFPFFRHPISSVRHAVLKTLSSLADLVVPGQEHAASWIQADLFRLISQNFVLEEKSLILDASLSLLQKLSALMASSPSKSWVDSILTTSIPAVLAIVTSPLGKPFDINLFVRYASAHSNVATKTSSGAKATMIVTSTDKAMFEQDLTVVSIDDIVYGRYLGSKAISQLLQVAFAHDLNVNHLSELLSSYLNSGFASHRLFTGIILAELGQIHDNFKSIALDSFPPSVQTLFTSASEIMARHLADANAGAIVLYSEVIPLFMTMHKEATLFHSMLSQSNTKIPPIPPLPGGNGSHQNVESELGPVFTIDAGRKIASEFLERFVLSQGLKPHIHAYEQKQRLEVSINAYTDIEQTLGSRVLGSFATALVSVNRLPPKLNPIVRSLVNTIKIETNEVLRSVYARGLASLIQLNLATPKLAAMNDKILKNLCAILCSDTSAVRNASKTPLQVGILSISMTPQPAKRSRAAAPADLDIGADALIDNDGFDPSQDKSSTIAALGAKSCIDALAKITNDSLFDSCPKLFEIVSTSLSEVDSHSTTSSPDDLILFQQRKIDALHILETMVELASQSLHAKIIELVPSVAACLHNQLSAIRYHAAKCMGALCKYIGVKAMLFLLSQILPLVNDPRYETNRQGAVECIYHVVQSMQEDVLPYLVFLIVPLLGRMSDSDEHVRFASTHVFAQLVKLAPLESGVPDLPDFTSEMSKKRKEERKFIGQLIGSEKVQEFSLPVPIQAELRPYQKEGVNWLAFLNRYGLHGILCDDMGLGKTLQSICMMAADHFNRQEKFKETQSPDVAHCPSLVVCPSTLTGHWFYEIKKYADFMRPIIYIGDKSSRESIRRNIYSYDIVIMSYEVLRNDINELSKFKFNYCTLDEGHVIKNPSTKLTMAVKSIQCFHRLILSGTPVQNNVLELWSLFDFLMPGFLGTEAQFNQRFGKKIIASRDAKASSKQQEQGALALEALHRQVLPFMMRRMKEDVLDDLPPKIIQDYYCDLSDLQKMLYEDFAQSEVKQEVSETLSKEGLSTGQDKKMHIFQSLQYLRKLCNHPALVLSKNHPKYNQAMTYLKNQGRKMEDIENAPKLLALKQLLLDCGIGVSTSTGTAQGSINGVGSGATAPHRALIFVQVKQMLDMIENDLFKKLMPSVTYMRLDGSTDSMARHGLVTKFNEDPSIDVLLLTTHVGGLGLNLTGADTVIFVEHDWNPMKDLQAMDRAHRIGQKRVVNVYRLITRRTLEEKIMGLQKFKLNIASSVVNQENSGIASMDTDQILDLFTLDPSDDIKKDVNENADGRVSAKKAIENLGELWDESQYDDLKIDEFFKSLT